MSTPKPCPNPFLARSFPISGGAICLAILGLFSRAGFAQEATAAAPNPPLSDGWTVGGYGEAFTATRFFGPDPNREYNPSTYRQTEVDLARVVFLANKAIAPWISFTTEVEIEHGGTGVAMEVEWEEFGEYEQEVEKGGEIVLEQAFIELRGGRDRGFPVDASLRFGHLLVPVGLISSYHLPILVAGIGRPEAEEALLPSTWHETGVEVNLAHRRVTLTLQGITGLDSTGFSSSRWIGGGTQRAFESVRANDASFAARLDYHGLRGLLAGISAYTGRTTGNRPKRDMDGVAGRVVIADIHARFQRGPFRFLGEAIVGHLGNADRITSQNASLAAALGAPRTPVGSAAYGYFVEGAVDLVGSLRPGARQRLDLFVRHDGYDTMWSPPEKGSGFDNPLLERRVLAAGLGYYPHPRVVFKGGYISRWINKDDAWSRRQQEVRFALGFVL